MSPDDFEKLEERIQKARQDEEADKAAQNAKDVENMSMGMRAGAELLGSIGGGAFIGWLLDRWLDTQPLLLIIFLLLGIATGFMNVYRTTQNIGHAVGYSQLHSAKKDAKDSPDKNKDDA